MKKQLFIPIIFFLNSTLLECATNDVGIKTKLSSLWYSLITFKENYPVIPGIWIAAQFCITAIGVHYVISYRKLQYENGAKRMKWKEKVLPTIFSINSCLEDSIKPGNGYSTYYTTLIRPPQDFGGIYYTDTLGVNPIGSLHHLPPWIQDAVVQRFPNPVDKYLLDLKIVNYPEFLDDYREISSKLYANMKLFTPELCTFMNKFYLHNIDSKYILTDFWVRLLNMQNVIPDIANPTITLVS